MIASKSIILSTSRCDRFHLPAATIVTGMLETMTAVIIAGRETDAGRILRFKTGSANRTPADDSRNMPLANAKSEFDGFCGDENCSFVCRSFHGIVSSSSGDDLGGKILVAPGGYNLFTCGQMATRKAGILARQKILGDLIKKAGDGLDGRLVSATGYQPEYISNKGQLDSIRHTEAEGLPNATQEIKLGHWNEWAAPALE